MLLALDAVTTGLASPAAAKDLRYPENGPVAFQLHLPDGWSAQADNGKIMQVTGPDHSAAMLLTVLPETERSLKQTPDEVAAALFAGAKAQQFSKHEKGAIGGVPADSYNSWMLDHSGQQEWMKINVIKSLHGYMVLETILTSPTIDSAQRAVLAAVLKGITLTGTAMTGTAINPAPPKAPTSPPRTDVTSNQARTDGPPNAAHTEPPVNAARIEIPLKSLGGTFVVPVFINGAITLNFIVDSGAADVSVPADVVGTLVRAGTIQNSDFTGKQKYVLADGSSASSNTFVIKSLKIGDITMENVRGSVAPTAGSLLLGQSFLQRFKSWSMDNNKHVLVLEQ